MYSLLQHILEDDVKSERPWLNLLDQSARDVLRGRVTYARVDMFEYKMSDSLLNIIKMKFSGVKVYWWQRKYEEALIQPVQLDDVSRKLAYANIT